MKKNNSEYIRKLKTLNETAWGFRINESKINNWLANFKDDEKDEMLFLLSNFIFFSDFQVKKMLISVFRDNYKYKHIFNIRKENGDTKDVTLINDLFNIKLKRTRFVALGNPSESSANLMYYFRQENALNKNLFISDSDIIATLENNTVDDFVFIDDLAGTGSQAIEYSKKVLSEIKTKFPDARLHYYLLTATDIALNKIKDETLFDHVEAVVLLNDSFKCFDVNSRIFKNSNFDINRIKSICEKYGRMLMKSILKNDNPSIDEGTLAFYSNHRKLGFGNGQLLLGFIHNTPDNVLPIIWYNLEEINWTPIFPRYNKKYND